MTPRFSIIVPTCGRRSLERTLRSIRQQILVPGDEVVLVADGPQALAAHLFRVSLLPGRCLETPASHDYGASQRNCAMDVAGGDFLLFMDDDDIFEVDALAAVRAALVDAPARPHLFRMRYAVSGQVLWADRKLALGNISTQMIVFPNHPNLERWDKNHGHDYRFVVNNLKRWPADALIWRQEIIAVIRPGDLENRWRHSGEIPKPGSQRALEACTYRQVVRQEGDTEVACCALLQEISAVEDPHLCDVQRDACEACCADALPSAIDPNPVVASLLFGLTGMILAKRGVAGCSALQAEGMQAWAEVNLLPHSPSPDSDSMPRRATEPCCNLGKEIHKEPEPDGARWALPVFECHHSAHRETTLAGCHWCRDWADHPNQVWDPVEHLVPPPPNREGELVRRWAVGVTTAPRRRPTIDWCLDSVIRAGWTSPRLFMDSRVAIADRFVGLPVTLRDSKLGAWPNFYLAVIELLMREPRADALMLIQDDVVLYDRYDLRAYLEQILWPVNNVGAVSLFCSSAYTQPSPGWHSLDFPWVCGAQAFVFPRESAKRFVADPLVLEHRWSNENLGLANIDMNVGKWAERHGLVVCYPTPSLVQHIGDTSTLWQAGRIDGSRKADQFAGDLA